MQEDTRQRWLPAAAAPLAILLVASAALGQGRGSVSIRTPGTLSRVGVGAIDQFRYYSFGVGSLTRSSAAPGGNVLRSSVAGPSSFDIIRAGGGATGGGAFGAIDSPGPLVGSRKVYSSPGTSGRVSFGGGRGAFSGIASDSLAPLAYLKTIGAVSDESLTRPGEPITSFVPEQPGPYRKLMDEAETAMRDGRYADAFDRYKLVSYIDNRDPAVLLGLAHTQIAFGRSASAAGYVGRALRQFPELPLLPIRTKAFFPSSRAYRSIVTEMSAVALSNRSPEAQLVVAYLEWFREEPDAEAARRALARGLEMTQEPDLTEAMEIFLDGIDAAAGPSAEADTRPAPSATAPAPADASRSPAPN